MNKYPSSLSETVCASFPPFYPRNQAARALDKCAPQAECFFSGLHLKAAADRVCMWNMSPLKSIWTRFVSPSQGRNRP